MARGFTIDASLMSYFEVELANEEGTMYEIVQDILPQDGLAVNEVIEGEWKSKCNSALFSEWFANQLVNGYIRYVEGALDPDIMAKIHEKFGFPHSKDTHYIRVANQTETRYILSADPDFYEPESKAKDSSYREEIMERRTGDLCQFLSKALDIMVGFPEQAREDVAYL